MILDIVWIVIGLATLIVGGEFLVKGAVGMATKARLSTLVIGMTVVSFGTSAPELLVSLKAAYHDVPEIAIGNVIGSNIANIALVLGLTVIIFPMPVSRNSLIFDWPIMMLASILFVVFSFNLQIERIEGVVLFTILVGFIYFLIRNSRKNKKSKETNDLDEVIKVNVFKSVGFILIGLIGLYFGAKWLIEGAKSLGESAGLSKHVIAITIVAFGTSVPELVTSVVAAYRKEMDISVGNLIGSNIFNIMSVIGLTAIVSPIRVDESVVRWDMIWMLAIALILLPMMWYKRKIGRISGIILLTAYFVYIYLLF